MRIAILLLAVLGCQAQDNTLTPAERKAGWILLFDGKTLDRWHDTRKMSPPGDSWTVENGCIKACAKPQLGEDLFSRDTFGDFEMVFDWRVSPHGNTGVKYRVQDRLYIYGVPGLGKFERQVDYNFTHRRTERPAKGYEYVIAFEYQIMDTDKPPTDKGATGALYELIGPSKAAAKPAGEFNHSRIVLKGNHVEHWLNGVKVVDADLTAPEVAKGLAERWGTESPVYKLLTGQPRHNTQITLQNHNDDAWFRNLKIRRL